MLTVEEIEFVFCDRYSALGLDLPDPATVCRGQCEGTGWVPISSDETDPKWIELWDDAEEAEPTDDGWHFVKCPECKGTGKIPGAELKSTYIPRIAEVFRVEMR